MTKVIVGGRFKMKKTILLKKYIPTEIIPKQGSNKKLSIKENDDSYTLLAPGSKKKIQIPKKIVLDQDDYIAIGLYLAEGYTKINPNAKYHHDGSITFIGSHAEMLNPICDLLEKFYINRADIKWKIGININLPRIHDELISYWVQKAMLKRENLRKKGIYYTGTTGKKNWEKSEHGCVHLYYPSVTFRSFFLNFIYSIFKQSLQKKNKREIALILKGFFAGDGCVYYSEKSGLKMVDFACNNLRLIEQIRTGLQRLGLTSIKETFPERTKVNNKSLRIYNLHDFRILHKYSVLYLLPYKKKIFLRLLDTYT